MPSNLDYQDFLTLKQQQKSTILFKKIINDKYPAVVCFQRLEQIFKKNILLLESVEKGSNKGRFSVIALLPDQIWRCYNNIAEINYHPLQNSNDFIKQEQSSVASLRSFINNAKFDISDIQNKFNYDRTISEGLEISSGIFGYFAYDFINIIENISNVKLDDEIAIPDAIFIRPTITLIFDSLFDSLLICSPAYNINDYDYQLAVDNITKIINIIFDETSNIAISANKNQQNQINQ
jgi:anthranilate synthase component 1